MVCAVSRASVYHLKSWLFSADADAVTLVDRVSFSRCEALTRQPLNHLGSPPAVDGKTHGLLPYGAGRDESGENISLPSCFSILDLTF